LVELVPRGFERFDRSTRPAPERGVWLRVSETKTGARRPPPVAVLPVLYTI